MEKIDPAMIDAYHRCATRNAWETKQDTWWEFRHGVQPTNAPKVAPKLIAAVKAPGVGHASAKRPHFLAELVKLIPKMMLMVTTCTKAEWSEEKWVVDANQDELFGALEGWVGPVRNILPVSDQVPCNGGNIVLTTIDVQKLIETKQIWALFDSVPARTYSNGSQICLLGVAAHASSPHQGSGGGMAMEDAFILSNLIGQIQDMTDIAAILKAYDLTRRPRSQRLVSSSREAGQLYHLEMTEAGDDETLRMNLETRYKWIWEADPDEELAAANRLFNNSTVVSEYALE